MDAAYAYQRAGERGEKLIVGVTAFQLEDEKSPEILYIDDAVGARQVSDLEAMRRAPRPWRGGAHLDALKTAPRATPTPCRDPRLRACVRDGGRDLGRVPRRVGTWEEPAAF